MKAPLYLIALALLLLTRTQTDFMTSDIIRQGIEMFCSAGFFFSLYSLVHEFIKENRENNGV
jgi:hypothetical protein